ncbi:MAG: GNAT family N-acetyltransferase [Bryobacteraceae bacterium]|nr:GNAT family N-acetyltransferase [Bryobacteraceae bacterium]
MAAITIREWLPAAAAAEHDSVVGDLARILHACVHGGASVSFVLPFTLEDAERYWRERILPDVRTRRKRVLLAAPGEPTVGTVQLDLDSPPNQRHRSEVMKLLVHPNARRQGVGRALMEAVERIAVEEGRTLLTLDTRSGDPSESLYVSMGYRRAGVIPGFARGPADPSLHATTILYKTLPR